MTLASDLLEQAWHLARLEPNEPRQASLRRAVSAAYYSLFHLITRDGAARVSTIERLRPTIARAFEHAELAKAARGITNIRPGQDHWLAAHIDSVPPDLAMCCETFAALQERRHVADYDASTSLTRGDVLTLLQRASGAHSAWNRVSKSDAALVFVLAALKILRSR
ncbi:MAG: hypothetical protein IT373_18670 [Polyangiaceae bacterium]|nr:hypothetical protein [Polyangiaceae bacterium]